MYNHKYDRVFYGVPAVAGVTIVIALGNVAGHHNAGAAHANPYDAPIAYEFDGSTASQPIPVRFPGGGYAGTASTGFIR